MDYALGTPKTLAISVYDEVKKGQNKSMGSATFEVGECLGARGNTKARKIKGGGTIFCHVAKSVGSGILRLGLKGSKLKNTEGFMRKSDPFYELSHRRDAGGGLTWDNVHRSEVVKDNLDPAWKDQTIELSVLCQGEISKPILISVFDYESSGKHVLMGQVETTVEALQAKPTLKIKVKGKETGTLTVTKADVSGVQSAETPVESVTEQMASASVSPAPTAFVPSAAAAPTPYAPAPPTRGPSFVDYISGGCEINVCVAIDFTGSNGTF